MEEKQQHTSLSAKHLCLQIHLFSQRIIWEILDNGYSEAWMPCPAERLMPPLFLDTSALERSDPESTIMQETRPTRQLHQSPGRLALFTKPLLHFVAFSHTERFLQTAVPRPRGRKTAENRMWIHPRLTNTLGEKPVAAVLVAPTCPLDLLVFFLRNRIRWSKRGFVFMPSKQCLNLISITS